MALHDFWGADNAIFGAELIKCLAAKRPPTPELRTRLAQMERCFDDVTDKRILPSIDDLKAAGRAMLQAVTDGDEEAFQTAFDALRRAERELFFFSTAPGHFRRPPKPREAARDAEIVRLWNEDDRSEGWIARKLKLTRPVVKSVLTRARAAGLLKPHRR